MRHWSRALSALAAAFLAGCGGGDDANTATGRSMGQVDVVDSDVAPSGPNLPPRIERLSLSPAQPRPGAQIKAEVQTIDPDGDPVQLAYRWRIDGRHAGDGSSIQVPGQRKGTIIELRVVPNDGQAEGEARTATVRVGNQAPVMVGVVLEPLGEVTAADDVVASPRAADPDGDTLDYVYTWTVNGREADSHDSVLPKGAFKRGDKITLSVMADDGTTRSEPLESQPIEVANAPPTITSSPGGIGADGTFRYQVQATDPDGDRHFRFRLLEAPPNMKIDPLSGAISWAPSDAQAGENPVKIEVDDMRGGKYAQSFELHVRFEDGVPANRAP